MIVIDIEEGGRKVRLAFSGDIGRGNNDILRDPDHPRDADYLITESTYGNREHEPLADVNDRVCAIINRVVKTNGKIIIPRSPSVARSNCCIRSTRSPRAAASHHCPYSWIVRCHSKRQRCSSATPSVTMKNSPK